MPSASTQHSSTATPIASPTHELNDPFASFSSGAISSNGNDVRLHMNGTNNTSTCLAAYLTSVANDPNIRQLRAWKRFVRVRTDDLQSVRAERAIKRVRSDLAAHSSPGVMVEDPRSLSQVLNDAESPSAAVIPAVAEQAASPRESEDKDSTIEGVPRDNAQAALVDGAGVIDHINDSIPNDLGSEQVADSIDSATGTSVASPVPEENDEDVTGRLTPVPSEPASSRQSRVPRSQSADPTSRASRIYSSPSAMSSITPDGESSTASITEDDSSISTTGRRAKRKKRSKSTDLSAA